jgi:dihydropyrimidinase
VKTCIENGTLVTASTSVVANLWIEDEIILGAGPRGARLYGEADRIIDASGCVVVPGGIDVHTHLDMPLGDITSSDDFETGTIAAACGGTTAIVDYIGHAPGQSLHQNAEAWRRRAERAVIDFGLHQTIAEATPAVLEEMADLVAEGITSFKVFLAYPGRLLLDDESVFRVMLRARELDALICVHAEAGPPLDVLVEAALTRGHTEPIYHALTRPEVAEATGTERALALAELADTPVYIVHVSCARALERIAEARKRGVSVGGETCPQYLFLDETALHGTDSEPFAGARFVCTPPLRPRHHQESLWQGLAAGDLSVVATDHCPFNFRGHKERGRRDFSQIPNGLPGIETRVALLWRAVGEGRITQNQLVEMSATEPARIFGLERKGTFAGGADADVVIWDPSRPTRLDHDRLHMRIDYSPYEGVEVPASVRHVFSRGEWIVADGEWVGASGRGRFVPRPRVT